MARSQAAAVLTLAHGATVLMLLACGTTNTKARPRPANLGSVVVDRVYSEHDFGYAVVSYANDSSTTFESITVECVATGGQGKIGVNQRSFMSRERGPIEPGFSGTIEVPVELHGAKLASMECKVSKFR